MKKSTLQSGEMEPPDGSHKEVTGRAECVENTQELTGRSAGHGLRIPPCTARVNSVEFADTLHQRGKHNEALAVLEQHLFANPKDLAAMVLQGRCLEALNNAAGAFTCYAAALTEDPNFLMAHLSCASLYKSRGMLNEALDSLKSARVSAPEDQTVRQAMAIVLTDLGTHFKLSGQCSLGKATELYKEAQEADPQYAPAFYNMGVTLAEAGQDAAAIEQYRKAVVLNPLYAEAHCNLGAIHKSKGELEEAIVCYQKALQAAPNFTMVSSNLAVALTDLGTRAKGEGKLQEAIKLYERALSYNPTYLDAMYNCAVMYGESGQLEKAIFMYEMTTKFHPSCAEAFNNLGVLHKERDNPEKALQCYMSALQLRPNFPESLNNIGVLYILKGQAKEAIAALQAAIQASPMYAEAYNNLGALHRDVGNIPAAIAAYDKCVEVSPEARNAYHNRLLALNYIYQGEDPYVCQAHQAWGRQFSANFKGLLPPLDTAEAASRGNSQNTFTVGYISPDLYTHSVSYFAHAPLQHHDSTKIRFIVYSCVPREDLKTELLKTVTEAAGGTWRSVTGMADVELAQLIRDDGVDILVELTGHTAHNRLAVMAMRAAPVQITWIGYPNSTGLAEVDYRITDAICDPPETRQTFSEELVRLPGCFLCYTPLPRAPPVSPSPATRMGFVTFGSFNSLAKITPAVLSCWGRILKAVPTSRLVLKNKPFACESAKVHFLRQLKMEGIDPVRIDLLPHTSGTFDHLSMYSAMDISLDPFPYAGTTTTTESLYMGVPCVTLAGNCHAHNVGVSLLHAVGLADGWIAHTQDEYVELAVRRGSDIPALAEIRAALRDKMLQSPMCDAVPFVRQLECVYSSLWSRWLDEHHSDRHVQECSPLEASEGSSLEEAVEVKVGELAVGCTGSAESTQISSGAPVESGQSECTSAAPGDENS